jgi:hypothetical protein
MSYAGMSLEQMDAMVRKEVSHLPRLRLARRMWVEARDELARSGASLGQEIATIAPQWTDQAGDLFVARASKAERGMAEWVARIDAAQPWVALDKLVEDIPEAQEFIARCLLTQKQLMADLNSGGAGSIEGQFAELQQRAAARMAELGRLFTEATNAVQAAGQGAGVTSAGGGGGPEATGGGPGGGPAGGPGGGLAGGPAGAPAGGAAGAPAGGPAAGGGAAGGPALSGGAVAPPKPPSVPPPVDLPQTRPTTALPQFPVAPPGVAPALSARGVGGRGVGGRGVGGAGLTGQSGVPMIPRAAKPGTVSAVASTPPPPALPVAGTTSTSQPATRGGVPPMVPPMSGAAQPASGKPKPGEAQRPPAGRGRARVGTPGVPEALRGRASTGGVLPTRTDRRRTAEADALDEELWQTEEPRSPLTGR